jgi:hypothetical protein
VWCVPLYVCLCTSQALVQVDAASFLVVQQAAARHGRMDLARVMMSAMDDTRKIQVSICVWWLFTQEHCAPGMRVPPGGGGESMDDSRKIQVGGICVWWFFTPCTCTWGRVWCYGGWQWEP